MYIIYCVIIMVVYNMLQFKHFNKDPKGPFNIRKDDNFIQNPFSTQNTNISDIFRGHLGFLIGLMRGA
jgi:hypothetical protein